mmetsp:Transcript_21025/g.23443  ORF Transcript_21025/g.23443 Transcript_21025/m.23443 type:complete len:215 (-) Transcript_21025:40-684(-)
MSILTLKCAICGKSGLLLDDLESHMCPGRTSHGHSPPSKRRTLTTSAKSQRDRVSRKRNKRYSYDQRSSSVNHKPRSHRQQKSVDSVHKKKHKYSGARPRERSETVHARIYSNDDLHYKKRLRTANIEVLESNTIDIDELKRLRREEELKFEKLMEEDIRERNNRVIAKTRTKSVPKQSTQPVFKQREAAKKNVWKSVKHKVKGGSKKKSSKSK